jgi:hypothetical protein
VTCLGCGHAKRNHAGGTGLCLVSSCRLCLIFRPAPEPVEPGPGAACWEYQAGCLPVRLSFSIKVF